MDGDFDWPTTAWLVSSPATSSMSKYRFTIHLLESPSLLNNVESAAPVRASQAQRHATGAVARFGAPPRYAGRPYALALRPKQMSSGPPDDRLDSWKEIAAYLGRGVRTVQRWEREEGLPVHRLAHEKRGNVYARREELAAWWESRRRTLAAQPDAADTDSSSGVRHLERATLTFGDDRLAGALIRCAPDWICLRWRG